jgi:two-component system cell cycle response regulator
MRQKILTIDDSKTVRLIIKKAFKPYDCEIFEAANGVEGLALAAKVEPALILLDITMPVMDGVEMLTRLKADPQLKAIPVVMLTAEGGRDHVLNIAKMGVRGYIVKPFKEEAMIEKVGHIIELKPASDAPGKARSVLDPLAILVVENKPAIVQQIEQGLRHTPWKIQGAASSSEAVDACGAAAPDLAVISLSLPDNTAFTLVRTLRANPKTRLLPIFALVVKTDVAAIAQAQEVGFAGIFTKPIDFAEVETKVAKIMNLDTSAHYYRTEGDTLMIRLPAACTPSVLAEATQFLGAKLAEAVDSGLSRVLIDFHLVQALEMGITKLLMDITQNCRELGMQFAIIGNPQLNAECREFVETRSWVLHDNLAAARAQLGGAGAAAPQLAAT